MRFILLPILLISFFAAGAQSIPNYRRAFLVSHLSGTNKYMLKRAGAPKHNFLTKAICFKWKCRSVVGWRLTQQRNKFKGYNKGPSIPRLKYLKADSLNKIRPQEAPIMEDTITALMTAQPARRDSVISFVFNDVLFDTNSSHLKAAFAEHLDSLSAVIRNYHDYSIQVLGHTDNSGAEKSNLRLSQWRAEAVASYLISAGIDESIITAEGRGSSDPIANNLTSEGREKNRRVEIFLKFD